MVIEIEHNTVTIIHAICREILLFLYKICLGVQQLALGCSYAFRETLILRYSPSKIFGENRKIASKNKVKIYVFNQDARKTKQNKYIPPYPLGNCIFFVNVNVATSSIARQQHNYSKQRYTFVNPILYFRTNVVCSPTRFTMRFRDPLQWPGLGQPGTRQ